MSDINVTGSEGEKGDEFVEVEEWDINPEDDLIDTLKRRIKFLNTQNEGAIKKAEELNQRLELAREALEQQKNQEKESFFAKLRLAIVLVLGVVLFFAFVSVSAPDILERMFGNSFTIPALGLSLILALSVLLLPRQRRSLDDTFLEIDRAFSRKSDLGGSPKGNIVNVVLNGSDQDRPKASDQDEQENFPKQIIGSSSDFEFCISEIVDYLGDHIKLAESKASKLLDKGTTYLRRGLYFYIGSIVIWQIWGHFVSFDGLVIAGMISTSIAFIIIEFLAAWFLKQYRSFVDSSMTYMRVQSFFNRYLLLYFAARDFGDDKDGGNLARSELLKVISLEIKWPELKDVNANDFNYMIEAMGSMHTSFEKLKGVFQTKGEKRK